MDLTQTLMYGGLCEVLLQCHTQLIHTNKNGSTSTFGVGKLFNEGFTELELASK